MENNKEFLDIKGLEEFRKLFKEEVSGLLPGLVAAAVGERLDTLEGNFRTINSTVSQLGTRLENNTTQVGLLKAKLDKYPEMISKTDNVTYAFKNGQWEEICGADEIIVVVPSTSASTLEFEESERPFIMHNA